MKISNRSIFLQTCKDKSINTLAANALIDWLESLEYKDATAAEILLDQDRYSSWGIDDDIEDFFALLPLDKKFCWNTQEVLRLCTIGDVLLFSTHHLLETL